MLTLHGRDKRRENLTVTDALCKALGWYFPLLAKMKVQSLEDIIFRKFPYACPYCRLTPHDDAVCKQVKGTEGTVDHKALLKMRETNLDQMPVGLDDWQMMFHKIYPRSTGDKARSIMGLFEELGEVAEAIRVFEKHPKYFIGEAADIFSYLMGIANEHQIRERKEDREFSLEHEFLKRYPGLCPQCGSRVCICPAIPPATIGRLAKELDIGKQENLFFEDSNDFELKGRSVSHRVLERAGGYPTLISKLPFDRGDANHALVLLCIKLAAIVNEDNPEFADKLRIEAYKIGSYASVPGSKESPLDATSLLREIAETWRGLNEELKTEIKANSSDLVEDITQGMETINVLFVLCSPKDLTNLRVSQELRVARESQKIGGKGNSIQINDLPAATIDDLRRELLNRPYEIVHFSGHANKHSLCFETADGTQDLISLQALTKLFERYKSVRCVVLNACESVAALTSPISQFTVGMEDSIDDDAAVEFSRGFYDGLAAGKNIEYAVEEGKSTASLKGLDVTPIRLLKEKGTQY